MPIKIVVPQLGESVVEATVSRWLKNEGDFVSSGEVLVELETDKVNLEVGSEHAGVLSRIVRQAGQDVRVGEELGVIEESSAPKVTAPAKESSVPEDTSAASANNRIIATPSARRLAQEHNVDLNLIQPGAGGRIDAEAVQRFLDSRQKAPAPKPAAAAAKAAVPEAKPATKPVRMEMVQRTAREERERMTRRRRTIAQRMVEAQRTAAILTTYNEINMQEVMELRKRRKESFLKKHGVGLGIVSFFVKAAVQALKDFPKINSELQGDEIVYKYYYDIGVAVGAEEGLVVPVLRDADRMSFAAIETAIKGFAEKANAGTLTLEDLRGGTFTVTNGGVFGSLLSSPILNPPQVAILGLHKIEERPVVINREIAIRPMMYVALSYDHRLIDGRESVQFLTRLKDLLEDPAALLVES